MHLSLLSSIKACVKNKDLCQGIRIHAHIYNHGLLDKDTFLGNTLISMYAKCGALDRACQVFDELRQPDAVSWNALIAGYSQQRQGKEALCYFRQMQNEGISPSLVTYASALKACGIIRDIDTGIRLHDEILSKGLLKINVVLGNALVDMYARCGALTKAQTVLDGLPNKDVVSWNALISGYTKQGQGKEALACYRTMQREGLCPDAITYLCILKACGIIQELDIGKGIHGVIIIQGLLEKNVVVGNALVDMYAKCGSVLKAQEVVDKLPVRDVISWSALIAAYAQLGLGEKALACYWRLQSDGLSPDAITYVYMLKACGIIKEADTGKKIHDDIVSRGLLQKNVMLGNALVDMYAKCGALMKAQNVFDELPTRDMVSWNALISGYAQQGKGKEALVCLQQMKGERFSPDAITYACILKACGITQDAHVGKQVHDEIASQALLEKDVVLGNALVDMYSKCGLFQEAQEVLDKVPFRNIVTWNALVAGYSQQGQEKEAFDCFERMRIEGLSPDVVSWGAVIGGYAKQGLAEEALVCFNWMESEGVSPDAVTFVSVLNACNHSGLVEAGQMCFESMREKYGITPDKEHETCMVSLFGRARHFDKAMGVLKQMPFSDHPPVWSALLGACQEWGNVKLGRLAFECAVQLDGGNAAAHVLMANIYAAAGMHGDAQHTMSLRVYNASGT